MCWMEALSHDQAAGTEEKRSPSTHWWVNSLYAQVEATEMIREPT